MNAQTLDTRTLADLALDLDGNGAHDDAPTPGHDDAPAWSVPIVSVPDLPPSARLTPALERAASSVGSWIDGYVGYASVISPRTPRLFHESGALWLGGLAIARRRRVRLRHGDIYPNLYVAWLAPTTLYAKTTALSTCERLAQDAVSHLLIAAEHTPEALLAELAGHAPANLDGGDLSERDREIWRAGRNLAAARGMVVDEVSGLFSSFRRDYSAGLRELILRLADAPDYYRRSTRGSGLVIARTAALSLIGATTPARLRRVDLESWWHDGLASRFVLLAPDAPPVRPSDDEDSAPVERPAVLVEALSRLANVLLPTPTFPDPIPCADTAVDDETLRLARRYTNALTYDLLTSADHPDESLFGSYGRLPTMAWKAAMIMAALDWALNGQDAPRITAAHWARAQQIAEAWRASAHRALAMLTEDEAAALEDRVMGFVQDAGPRGVRLRDIYRALGLRREAAEAVMAGLVRDGLITEAVVGNERGRPSLIYRAVRRSDD